MRQFAPAMQSLSPSGYSARLAAAMATLLAAVWLYVIYAPLAFMPSGYTSWVAKLAMLRDCQPAAIDFFGDSRVEAGIVPAVLPVAANNLGVAGGTPIEVESAVRRALQCATRPELAVIALGEDRFGPLDQTFWVESLGYGLLSFGDLWHLERTASVIGDRETLGDARTQEGLSGPVRDWLYELRFPSLSFSSLSQGQIFRRYADNAARLRQIENARGFVPYPPLPPTDETGPEAELTGFPATGLQAAAFEHALAMLHDSDVPVVVMTMPIKQVTRQAMAPGVETAYVDYLRSLAARFPNVGLVGFGGAGWPSAMFTDAMHLNALGAQKFSARLGACIRGVSIPSDCDLNWDPRVSRAGYSVGPK